MFTRAEAERRGWTFPIDGDGFVLAVNPDGEIRAKVASDTPYFFAVEQAALDEGELFPEARDGATILAVSGETYVPPPAGPVVVPPLTAKEALAEIASLPVTATLVDVIEIAKKSLG